MKMDEKTFLIFNKKIYNRDRPKKIEYISFAKIIASYGVIVLHINHFWYFNLKKKKEWQIANIYETLFYFSVPFFALSIGATLLNFKERYGLYEYNKRRFIKVFIPLIGWTFILYLYKVYILKNIKKENFNFYSLWNYFFLSKIYHIFGSLQIFLKTYMLIPLLAYEEAKNKQKIYIYYFFFLLTTQTIIPYIIRLFGEKIVFIYKMEIGYLIYIFAGNIIHENNFSFKITITIYILGIFSFIIHLIGTKTLTFKYNRIISLHKGYLNLPCIIYSCSLFLFLKENYHLIFGKINKKYINKIGSLTLGPFFMHLAIKETIENFTYLNKISSFNLLFKSFIIFLISIALSLLLKNIILLNFLVP